MIFWFCGASMQAVVTGAYRAVEFIKKNMRPRQDRGRHRGLEDRREDLHAVRAGGHVEHLHRADDDHAGVRVLRSELLRGVPDLHRRVRLVPGDLHGQRRRRVGQRQEGRRGRPEGKGNRRCTPRRSSATRSAIRSRTRPSVALNPIIKFSTLFGLLAVEIAVEHEASRPRERRHETTARSSAW